MERIKYIFTFVFVAMTTLSFASCPVKKVTKTNNTPVDTVAVIRDKAQKGDAKAQIHLELGIIPAKKALSKTFARLSPGGDNLQSKEIPMLSVTWPCVIS